MTGSAHPKNRRPLKRPDSSAEYAARMHRVLQHIDDHLDESLELDKLASVANFSSFHFHRLFTAWLGETVGDYTRRRSSRWRPSGWCPNRASR